MEYENAIRYSVSRNLRPEKQTGGGTLLKKYKVIR